jgi:hypothetical protein
MYNPNARKMDSYTGIYPIYLSNWSSFELEWVNEAGIIQYRRENGTEWSILLDEIQYRAGRGCSR